MQHGPQAGLVDLSFAVPSECARRVEQREADLGIVPVVEIERLGLVSVPGVGIACRGPVRSILLISKKPFSEIRTLAGDTSSRTSVVLTRIILSELYGAEPEVDAHDPRLDEMLGRSDAALVIGDPALRIDAARLPYYVLDLGAAWTELTKLPMVFAVWAGFPGSITPEMPRLFRDSYLFGKERIDDVVRAESAARGVTEELAREYLTRRIVFELGAEEEEGMRLFLSKAARWIPAAIA